MSTTSALPRDKAIARILELTGRPEAKSDKPWLVVTVGLPGSGKSTFARKLAGATGAVRLESDALRRELFAMPTHEPEESQQLFDAVYGATAQLLGSGVSVIIDATNLRERDRKPAYDTAAGTGANVLVLHFRASERDIAQRLAARTDRLDPEDRSTAGMAVYAKMVETEEPLSCAHWRIDTSDAGATQEALQRAIDTLKTKQDAATEPHRGGSIS